MEGNSLKLISKYRTHIMGFGDLGIWGFVDTDISCMEDYFGRIQYDMES